MSPVPIGRSVGRGIVAVAFALALGAVPAAAAPSSEQLNELIKETQIQSGEGNTMRLVWWLPSEFWALALTQGGQASEQQIGQVTKVLDRYVMVAVTEGQFGPMGGMTFTAEEAVRAGLWVTGPDGARFAPLESDDIDPDARNFIAMMRPMMAGMLGAVGQNIHFFMFRAVDDGGRRIADPRVTADLIIEFMAERFRFRLPLGSLLPKKVCPKDQELLNGAWRFCPRHGVELRAK